MTHEEIMQKLNAIFQDIFDDDSIVVTESTTADDIDEWDSLEHINLVDTVEKEFGMKFRMQEVSGMKNVGEMAEIIAQRRACSQKEERLVPPIKNRSKRKTDSPCHSSKRESVLFVPIRKRFFICPTAAAVPGHFAGLLR